MDARLCLALGNGAVFKLVPQYFTKDTGTVTGLVGAIGGLGGFFPPLLLGIFFDTAGVVWPGFVLLSLDGISAVAAERAHAAFLGSRCRRDGTGQAKPRA